MSESTEAQSCQPPEGATDEMREDSSQVVEQNEKPKPRLKLAWVAVGLAIAFTAIAQYFAPQFDHQNANLIGLTCLAIATLFFLYSLHRVDRWNGHPVRLPLYCVLTAIVLIAAFQFEGFNGEMLPQFRLRFAQQPERELKSVVTASAATDELAETIVEDVTRAALVAPNQFLGPNRNGVYLDRQFKVPLAESDVKVLWDQGIGEGWSSFAVDGDLAITLEQRDDQECLTCYRLTSGELVWIQKHKARHENALGGIGPRSTPTIIGNRVYAASATGHLWCVDRLTGAVVWTANVLQLAGWNQVQFEVAAPWGYACSPLLADGLCIVSLGGPKGGENSASLIALDSETGDPVWRSGTDQLSYASPVQVEFAGQSQIVSVNEKSVSGHRVEDGKMLWEFDWPGSTNTGANCSLAIPVAGDRILVGKGYGGGSALVGISFDGSKWLANDVWRSSRVLKTKFNHTCVEGDIGYAISNGALQAVNLADATSYWTQPRRSRAAQGQVVLVGDVLVLQDEAGDVVLVQATIDDYLELFRIPALDSKTWNVPTIAGRHILVRNDRQAICLELPIR